MFVVVFFTVCRCRGSSDHCTTAVPGLSGQGSGLIMHVCNNNSTTKAAADPALSDRALRKISFEYLFTSEQKGGLV